MAKKKRRKARTPPAPILTEADTRVKRNVFLMRAREIALLFSLVAVAFLIYSNTLDAPFIFDDGPNITANPHIRLTQISSENLWRAGFQGPCETRPISKISFALNYYFHQYDVRGYHLVNILIHIFTGIFLYLFLKITLNLPSQRAGNQVYSWVPFLTVLIWLVHPIQTQSVTYIVQRMNSLATMFYMLSLLFYAKARLVEKSGPRALLFGGCMLAGILSLGSKQIAATLPFFIFLYEWYFFQELSWSWLKRHALPLVGVLLLFVVLTLIFLGINPLEQILASYKNRDFTLGQRVLTQFRVVIFYLGILIFPHPSRLNLDRDFVLSTSPFSPITTLLCMLAISGLIGLAIYRAKRQPLVSFGILWFFGNLIIESSVIGLEIIFDHRTYLPSMFVVLIVVMMIQRYARPKTVGFIFLGAVALMFSIWAHERNGTWNDEAALWQDCVIKSPNKARPHNNLGLYLGRQGRSKDAMRHYSEALRIKPNYAEAHNNLCTVLYNQGSIQEAFTHCTAALRIKPQFADAHSNLGMVLAKQAKVDKAIEHYAEALRIKPDHANAHNNMGDALTRQGKHEEAIHHFSIALAINPKLAKAHFGMGRTFRRLGEIDEAINHFSLAAQIQPDYYQAYYQMGNALREQGRTDEAIRCFVRAINIKPDYASAQNNLGIVLGMKGRFQEAVKHLLKAVRLKPHNADYHFNLANALTGRGKHKEAVEHYSKAAGLNPFDAELQETLNRAKRLVTESDIN
jgi:tetratricopeptide (TPR) repeat protein